MAGTSVAQLIQYMVGRTIDQQFPKVPAERGAEVRYHDPLVRMFEDASGRVRESEGLQKLLAWADVIVVVTAHRTIDWGRIYDTADLVIDTVNSSAGQRTKPGQVLRLGAGWGAANALLDAVPVAADTAAPDMGQATPSRS